MSTGDQKKASSVAVIGSGLAGLTTAYLLRRGGYEVELFEKASSIGMDAGSISVDGVRVDVPFRVFTPDYYPYLYSLYRHLGIDFSAADYSLGFADENAHTLWSYTNLTLGDFQLPVIDGITKGQRLIVTRDWIRLVFICVRAVRAPAMLRPGGQLDQMTIGQYLDKEQYSRIFVNRVFVPFIASLLTCSLSAARDYPANTVLHFVSKAVCGARLRKAKNGVQEVCEVLARGIKTHLGAGIRRMEIKENVLLVTDDNVEHWFDKVVLATPADTAARLLRSVQVSKEYPPADLLAALDAVPYEDTVVVTHRDTSVMPEKEAEWRGVNIRTSTASGHAMATHWINFVERTSTGRKLSTPVFQTVDPLVKLSKSKIISKTTFHRSLVSLDSQARINSIHRHQGTCGVWLVGTYTSPGVPLLEGCVRTAIDVARAMGVSPPFAAPHTIRTSHPGTIYEVGLADGMARGEIVEAFFENDAAGTFDFPCPKLPTKRSVGAEGASLAQWIKAFMAWFSFTLLLPLFAIALSAVDWLACMALGHDLGCRVQFVVLDVVVFAVCMVQTAYKRLALL
ncbi:hypothetical protein LPJ78_001115 [Coemansia sp. RSA 989]|nr:hypothetical protein LPJ68_005348 [Coemansia sp. RSA 1086]KAJ1751141.1 hypothetical protein LPJ79_002343 [Coemansia sp. RSA 1821]KAJ1867310.1 hypothetical protein LPJ78_001115 [Coemansia sp. RSA 989]KAJ2672334.1 hypothetical protein IWW42_002884 [Coemansia sp. RSA 1085]